jgi:hypothetical protein
MKRWIPPWMRTIFRLAGAGLGLVRIYFLRRRVERLEAEGVELKRQVEAEKK